MSDNDFMQESDQEEYDFEYEDASGDEEDEAGDATVENRYYNAKLLKADNPEEAISELLAVRRIEAEKGTQGQWGFKALKQAMKVEIKLGRLDEASRHYQDLLTYIPLAVTRNYAEKSVNSILENVDKAVTMIAASPTSGGTTPVSQGLPAAISAPLERFYDLTLAAFEHNKTDRLWLKTNLKLAKLWLDRKDYTRVQRLIEELHAVVRSSRTKGNGQGQRVQGVTSEADLDPTRGTLLQEIYALEIQMYAATRNTKRMRQVYADALKVHTGVPHPRIMGVIRECGGKMHMSEEDWQGAYQEFFEAFRNYDEAGEPRRIQVLKYLVLAAMLLKSDINPLESQETKPYRNDPAILPMTNLVEAYTRHDFTAYEQHLQENKELLEDPYIADNIDEVTRDMRSRAVLRHTASYSRFTVDWIARLIGISQAEATEILVQCIVDGRLKHALIDETTGVVEIKRPVDGERVEAIRSLSRSMHSLCSSVIEHGDGINVPSRRQPMPASHFTSW